MRRKIAASAATFDPGTLANDTTYYWRIDEVNTASTTTGNVWSFTTVAAPAGDVEIIGSWVSGTTHTEESGANRLLVFTAHVEDNDTDMNLTSVTYGGQSYDKGRRAERRLRLPCLCCCIHS